MSADENDSLSYKSSLGTSPEEAKASEFEKKRLRTKTACDYCRKRKSKCNGEMPCPNCVRSNRECTYTVVQKQRKKRVSKAVKAQNELSKLLEESKSSTPGSVQGLNARLSVLEALLTKLTGKLPATKDIDTLSPPQANYSPTSTSVTSSPGQSKHTTVELITNGSTLKDMLAPNSKDCSSCGLSTRFARYFGKHSIFRMFSDKSIDWVKNRLKDDDLLTTPLKNFPAAITEAIDATMEKWADHNLKTSDVDITLFFSEEHKSLVFEILEYHYSNTQFAQFICKVDTIREIFQVYFYRNVNKDYENLNTITQSSYLLMNIAVALCLSNSCEVHGVDPLFYPRLSASSENELHELKEQCFKNATYLYDRVSIVNEGITTIQGFALMVLYVETTYVCDFQLNYTLVTTMIRHAQEMGLENIETYAKVEDAEKETRRKLLWFCIYMDMDSCYRNGKKTVMNYDDMSTLTEIDPHFMSVPINPFKDNTFIINSSNLVQNCLTTNPEYYYGYYYLFLNRLRYKSYQKLFSTRASTVSGEELLTLLEGLNEEMKSLSDLMEKEVRPELYDAIPKDDEISNPAFRELSEEASPIFQYDRFIFKAIFFSHLATINRTPFYRNLDPNDKRVIRLGNISLQSSRTILHMIANIDTKAIPKSVLTWLTFYPLISFCVILSNAVAFPIITSTHEDCLLLIKASMNFFKSKDVQKSMSSWEEARLYDNKQTIIDLISRLFLRILVNTMNIKSEHRYFEEMPGLEDHLKACQTIYPELFQTQEGEEKEPDLEFWNGELNKYAAVGSTIGSYSTTYSPETESSTYSHPDPTLGEFLKTPPELFNFDSFNEESLSTMLLSQMTGNNPFFEEQGNTLFMENMEGLGF